MGLELPRGYVKALIMSLLLISSCYDSFNDQRIKASEERRCESDADCSDDTRVDACHSGNCANALGEPDSSVTPNLSDADSSEIDATLDDVDAKIEASTAIADSSPNGTLCPNGVAEQDLIIDSAASLVLASGCTKVKGNVLVFGKDIDNIDALSNLTTIEGSLIIQEVIVFGLLPLSKLVSIGKDLDLFGLDYLTDLEGLGALTTVGGKLTISEDINLVDLHALVNLTPIADDRVINLKKNRSLPTCEAKWLMERLGRQMDGSDPFVEVCETETDSCGDTGLCQLEM